MRLFVGSLLMLIVTSSCAEAQPPVRRRAPDPLDVEGTEAEITSAMAYSPPAPAGTPAPATSSKKKKKSGSDCGYHPLCILKSSSEVCHVDDDGCERCTCQ